MRKFYLLLLIYIVTILSNELEAQQKISFPAKDGLEVTADLYFHSSDKPYVLLFHQAPFSRGEYNEIAPRIVNLGYNCLAVDLRSGSEVNGVINETARRAREKGLTQYYIDALADIKGAIAYVKSKTDKPFILWGSSYSASLVLILATEDLRTQAAIVFSPGEYFEQSDFIASRIASLAVPVLVLSSKSECESVGQLMGAVKRQQLVTNFCPAAKGKHGSSALWKSNPSNTDYWLAVTMFFSKLNPK